MTNFSNHADRKYITRFPSYQKRLNDQNTCLVSFSSTFSLNRIFQLFISARFLHQTCLLTSWFFHSNNSNQWWHIQNNHSVQRLQAYYHTKSNKCISVIIYSTVSSIQAIFQSVFHNNPFFVMGQLFKKLLPFACLGGRKEDKVSAFPFPGFIWSYSAIPFFQNHELNIVHCMDFERLNSTLQASDHIFIV